MSEDDDPDRGHEPDRGDEPNRDDADPGSGGEPEDADEPRADGMHPLAELLDTLLTVAESDRVSAETGGSISTVEDHLDRRRAEERSRREAGRSGDAAADDYHLRTQRYGDEYVVVADLLGATEDEIEAGVSRRTGELVIRRSGEVVGRASLPWDDAEATSAWFNNGILEIHLRPVRA